MDGGVFIGLGIDRAGAAEGQGKSEWGGQH